MLRSGAALRLSASVGLALAALTYGGTGCQVQGPSTGPSATPSGAGAGASGSSGPARVTQIASGAEHSCALLSDGTARCWGRNARGQLGDGSTRDRVRAVPVQGLADAAELALGAYHSCARLNSGQVKCWGAGNLGQLGDGSTASMKSSASEVKAISDATQIDAGDAHTCVRHADGGVSCWGSNQTRQLGRDGLEAAKLPLRVEAFRDAAEVAAGGGHTCVRRQGGSVLCFGANRAGQLGDGTDRGHARPSKVQGLEDAIDIAAGFDGSCAARRNGAVVCWGDVPGASGPRAQPVRGLSGVTRVEVSEEHACAQSGAALSCWGSNIDGRLGDGSFTSAPQPRRVSGLRRANDLSVGRRFTCALDGQSPKCWGDEYSVTAGPMAKEGGMMPVRGVEGARGVASGEGFSCAIDEDGAVWCWGANDKGQLGNGDRRDRDQPSRVKVVDEAVALSAGRAHACAAQRSGQVYCWGDDSEGQITPSRSGARPIPARVGGPKAAVSVAAGRAHSCAVERTGEVLCWGNDDFGQLGDGAGRRDGRVSGISDAVQVTAGDDHSCVRRRNGSVACWGSNKQGQLGNGVGAAQLSVPVERPVVATKVLGTTAVLAGEQHTCAILQDGRAQCWGRNDVSQLGSGTSSTWTTRVPVKGLAGASALGVGLNHACANAGGRLQCWGDNRKGQGTGQLKVTPTPATGPTVDLVEIEGGADHTCGRTRSGAVVCWGDDARGQLGLGDRGFARVPTDVAGF